MAVVTVRALKHTGKIRLVCEYCGWTKTRQPGSEERDESQVRAEHWFRCPGREGHNQTTRNSKFARILPWPAKHHRTDVIVLAAANRAKVIQSVW